MSSTQQASKRAKADAKAEAKADAKKARDPKAATSAKAAGGKAATSVKAAGGKKAGAGRKSVPAAEPSRVPHPALNARVAAGLAARERTPLESHAAIGPDEGRPDPVDLLLAQAETRVPELVPVRHGRMLVSPFTFFRGA